MAHGKRYRQQYEKVERDRAYPPGRGGRADQGDGQRQVRRDGRAAHPARRQRPPRRGAAARHPGAARTGSARTSPIAVFAQGQQARDAEAAGADFVGGRRPRREGRGGLDRLRRRDRDPGHDADGRQARPRPRPAGQDAEPEGRHRHRRHREGRQRVEGGQGRVPHRPPGDRPPGDRQGQLRRATSCSTTTPR